MLFNSLAYAIFLPLVILAYFAVPHRLRWAVLLVFSYYFYMSWNPELVVLILFTTTVSWSAALLVEKWNDRPALKKAALVISVGLCLAVLFFFKYFNFVSESVTAVCRLVGLPLTAPVLDLVLPVGISFYTFQTLSYVVDVYRGDLAAEHHFGIYALYVSFFPQLVAGPIERAGNLLPQFRVKHSFSTARTTEGLAKIGVGLFKKVVVADYVAPFVNAVYNDLGGCTGLTLIFATCMFAVQIYCDFCGYSEIAVGSAKILGFDLMENFRSPYFARSIREFWRRWHISLSTWFSDYIYIPLGGSRCAKHRHLLNLIITFGFSGLWHGANWTFV
ncbi:MAG: MBOAT family protein, partial [Faecalibacterium sp.]|nr:MBOAT family protein [Faecalibacterium sp.]